ncbi:hypothetical protein G3580_02560 [Nitrogeniibacter mangrovi]|uniref:Uncharacterized protein n=1 Tax=Nitrogeniibacter mangrovi TaxID=2016596 RepID=A0A6C1AZ35_9RHOO|nr:hypothetical protein [Nitrogeniibacter mangrovi]QID16606.1 hypothetical protein G3580_02560 [Nitrogeniibacter mangrovi]
MKTTSVGLAALVTALMAGPAMAWDLDGTKQIELVRSDGSAVHLGQVVFTPADGRVAFQFKRDDKAFQDYFLSMKEFKCITGEQEVFCHVPYPYPNPKSVTRDDLAWLEHAFLFLHKSPTEFGARLWNGVIYKMSITDDGIVGRPQAVDLNAISSPPTDPAPPYGPGERSDIEPSSREFGQLRIR